MKRILILVLVLALFGCAQKEELEVRNHHEMDHPMVLNEEIFIAEMIPHHQEAIDTSRQMLSSKNEKVVTLARGIISAQDKEIIMMRGWMSTWYPDSTYESTYQNMMPDLSSFSGSARDRAYLEGMIVHHQGAIEMAKQAKENSLRSPVLALADAIIKTQQEEIDVMNSLLEEN